jgi:LPS-assembly lipoprotein
MEQSAMKYFPRPAKLLIALVCCLLLASCGWQLRGSERGTGLQEVRLLADDRYTPLYRSFSGEMERRDIAISENPRAPAIALLEESFHTTLTSLDTELNPAERELRLVVRYELETTGTRQRFSVTVIRNFIDNRQRAAAGDNEKDKLRAEMRREAVDRILAQLAILLQRGQGSP